ncbi:MAG: translation initiation factor IF-2 [Fibrobacterota bacterium]
MVTKRTSGNEPEKKSKTVRTAPAVPAELLLEGADATKMEEELFGEMFRKPPENGVQKKGIVKRAAPVAAPVADNEATAKKALNKKLAGGDEKKTKIVRKSARPVTVPEPAPAPEEGPAIAPVAATAAGGRTAALRAAQAAAAAKEAEKKGKRADKEGEWKKEKPEDKVETRALSTLEKAIREAEAAGSGKKAKESTLPDDAFEEYEEVVEEIIEEVEYEDEAPAAPVEPIGKSKAEEAFGGFGGRRRRKKRKRKNPMDAVAAKDAVKRTLAQINVADTASKKKYRRVEGDEGEVLEASNTVRVSEFMSVSEIANLINVKPAEAIAACMKLGFMVTINQRLDFNVIAQIVDEFGFQAELMEEYAEEVVAKDAPEDKASLKPRPPIVTVMGHVDHGKTSLLDYIRKTNVTAGEAGGITQHIGAYRVQTVHGPVTFLDTPGHEAFATMRARGASITDLIILVVAADSHVMPQTIESIDHAKAAGVKIVVAINKVDLPNANVQTIKLELSQRGVIVEDFGGPTVAVEISCKTGQNIARLLEVVALEAEILELKANPDRPANGAILEARMDSRLGSVATVLVTSGTLRVGDNFVTGPHYGRVKLMTSEAGVKVDEAGPTVPVLVLGLSGTPRAGDTLTVVENERVARDISVKRSQAEKEKENRQIKHMSLDDLYQEIKIGGVRDVNLVVKGDVDGSVEALSDALQKLSTDKIKVNIIHKSVGAIRESDILLAATTNAVVIGFHLHPNSKVRELAHEEGVEIRLYKIIYEAIEELEKAMAGMLEPKEKEVVLGSAEVRNTFKISKVGTIAGCYVTKGLVKRSAQVRVIRDEIEITVTRISSLKRVKDDASEVTEGYECGILLDNYNDIKEKDVLEFFEIQKIK